MKLQAKAVLRRVDLAAPLRLAGVLMAGAFHPLAAQDAWGPLHLEVGLVALAPLTPVVASDAREGAADAMVEARRHWSDSRRSSMRPPAPRSAWPRMTRCAGMRHPAMTDPVRRTMDVPGLSVYPATDTRFRIAVETSYGWIEGPIMREALLAAVAALLRPSYPLATVQSRASDHPRDETLAWEAFRDATVLDDELLRRGRSGLSDAVGQLYDRHGELAYGIAMRTSGDPAAAADAGIEVFRVLIARDEAHLTVRVRLARGARDAALASGAADPSTRGHRDPLTEAQRLVLELAHTHRVLGTDIATVLRLGIRDVRRLANEGTAALAVMRGVSLERESGRPRD